MNMIQTYSSMSPLSPVLNGQGGYVKTKDYITLQNSALQLKNINDMLNNQAEMIQQMWERAGNKLIIYVPVLGEAEAEEAKKMGVNGEGWYYIKEESGTFVGPYVEIEQAKADRDTFLSVPETEDKS